jgi:hypothetical protein
MLPSISKDMGLGTIAALVFAGVAVVLAIIGAVMLIA